MRARMALKLADIPVEIREISLRDKPTHMLKISPKGTVPVLLLEDETVIEQSLEIMIWAFKGHTMKETIDEASIALIVDNDSSFKKALDAYKYPERNPNKSQIQHRAEGELFLQRLEHMLSLHTNLLSEEAGLADLAIFPFVRQFAAVDDTWWQTQTYPKLYNWLHAWVESALFKSVMTKNPTFVG